MRDLIDFLCSYSLEDFMPMGLDIYLRLFERVNAAFWPWHSVTLLLGLSVFWLLISGREKPAWVLLGSMWILVGSQFHWRFFSELNWGATYFAWGFFVQGALLFLMQFQTSGNTIVGDHRLSRWLGTAFIGFSLLGFPFLSLIFHQSLQQAQVFGISPDPTCLFTLGAILMSRHKAWWLIPLPILWCTLSGAIAYALSLLSGLILLILGLLFLTIEARRRKPKSWFGEG